MRDFPLIDDALLDLETSPTSLAAAGGAAGFSMSTTVVGGGSVGGGFGGGGGGGVQQQQQQQNTVDSAGGAAAPASKVSNGMKRMSNLILGGVAGLRAGSGTPSSTNSSPTNPHAPAAPWGGT
jgi:hypothetical protein